MVGGYDFVIYNKYIFDHSDDQNMFLINIGSSSHSLLKAPKTLGISRVLRVIKVSFVTLMRKASKDGGWSMEPTKWLEGWNFLSHSLSSRKGRGAGGWTSYLWPMAWTSMTMQWSCYKNPKGLGLVSFQAGEHMEIGESGEPFPQTLPYIFLHLAVDLYPLSYPSINR